MAATKSKPRVVVGPRCKNLYAAVLVSPDTKPEISNIGPRRMMQIYARSFNGPWTKFRCVLRPITWKLAKPISAKGGAE